MLALSHSTPPATLPYTYPSHTYSYIPPPPPLPDTLLFPSHPPLHTLHPTRIASLSRSLVTPFPSFLALCRLRSSLLFTSLFLCLIPASFIYLFHLVCSALLYLIFGSIVAAASFVMLINSSLHILLFRFLSPLCPFCSNYTSLLGFLLGLPNSLFVHVINLCPIPFPLAAVVVAAPGHAAAPVPPLTPRTLLKHSPTGDVS